MADPPRPGRSTRLDRVGDPNAPTRGRDAAGKEALYSTAPSAARTSQVLVLCRRCDIETGISVVGLVKQLAPPTLWNPITKAVLARCPTCQRRSWLRVRKGQELRALLDRRPTR